MDEKKYFFVVVVVFFGPFFPNKKPLKPPKINIEPENDGLECLEDVFPFPELYSQVPC